MSIISFNSVHSILRNCTCEKHSLWSGPGVTVRTLDYHAEDLGSNPTPDRTRKIKSEARSDVPEYVPVWTNVLLAGSDNDELNKPPKAIGIEYADGKYYFLQSEDESDDELIEQVSSLEGESAKLPLVKNEVDPVDDMSAMGDAELESDPMHDSENQFEMVISGDFDLKEELEQPEQEEQEDCDALFVEEAPTEIGTDSLIEEASVITTSEAMEAVVGPECLLSEVVDESSHPQILEGEVDAESLIERDTGSVYGSVEVLDEHFAPSSKEKRVDVSRYCHWSIWFKSELFKSRKTLPNYASHTGVTGSI
ncbi:hypothetical protein RP20_CCG014708 [Aedes albopictus]|nr:hypothetical protein RP20_CCG014708 [Aedes albopictus]